MNTVFNLFQQFFPPDLSLHYLRAELPALGETVEIAAAGMLLALCIGFFIGAWVGAGLPGGRFLYGGLLVVRSFPDIVLALLCVVIFGVGTGPGMVAIALFYGAAIGKIYADLLLSAPQGPIQALQASGATRFAVALFGLLPLRSKDLVSYGAFEFESAVRAAVIVGAVGGGGLGVELLGTINGFEYHRACTLILMLIVLIALLDQVASLVKRKPALLFGLLPLMAVAVWNDRPTMLAFQHSAETFGKMFPPDLRAGGFAQVPLLVWQTLEIAFGGTLLAVIAAIPLALCAARNFSPFWLSFPARRTLEILRSVPEVVWGLVLVTASVLGPPAGIVALALHCTGSLGRLFAESFENVAREPIHALSATGAPPVAIAAFAYLPMAAPTLAVHVLFRLEWNVRAATVVGIIGAGGVGEALFHSMQLFFYREMMAYILITGLLVAAVDFISTKSRQALGLGEVFA